VTAIAPTEQLALAALVSVLPVVAIDEALRACGQVAERVRTLPPWVTVYHVLASAMCPSAGYDQVTRLLWTTLPAATGRGLASRQPTAGAITRARARLGTRPLAELLGLLAPPAPGSAVNLHRFDPPGMPALWWITDSGTGSLRGCDPRGAELGLAAELVRAAGAHHVSCAPGVDPVALQARLGLGIKVAADLAATDRSMPWHELRARTPGGWQQDVLARACVSVAVEAALRRAAAQSELPRY
jgi:hypothetical protein